MAQVSVITPVFNTEDYLHQCIQSVLTEDDTDVELILIDDGSTDNSLRICRHYEARDQRVKVISKENQGQGIARNVGIEQARGKYLYFLDSDDYMLRGSLGELLSCSNNRHLDICAPSSPGHYYERPLEFVSCIPTRMQFVRADLIDRFELRQPDVASGQDGVFGHLLLSHCRRFGVSDKAVCHYRSNRPGSTFAKYSGKSDLVSSIVRKHYEFITQHYDAHELWQTQAVRLLTFMVDETMKNRLAPHFDYIEHLEKQDLFHFLGDVAKRAYDCVPRRFLANIHPAVVGLAHRDTDSAIRTFQKHYLEKKLEQPLPRNFNAHNEQEELYVCKPHWKPSARNSDYVKSLDRAPSNSEDRVKLIESKLDYSINTLVNTQADIRDVYAQHSPVGNARRSSLIVSMTTLHDRLATIHLSIESIFGQTRLPEKVILWVDECAEIDLNRYPRLQKAIDHGLHICPVRDVGPHTKLVYAAQRFPEKTIVTMDDDMIYPPSTLSVLEEHSRRFPNMVIANWARELTTDKKGIIQGTRAGRLLTPTALEKEIEQETEFAARPSFRAFPYGTSGVLYPPGCLHSSFSDFELMRELCPKEDDIWFKAMTLLTGTPVVPTNLGINPRHFSVNGTQNVALRHANHAGGSNRTQMKNVFHYFDLYPRIAAELEDVLLSELDFPW